jgi:hypothetical protein
MVVIVISAQDEVYLTQHYVIKIVRDLQQVGGFLHQPQNISSPRYKSKDNFCAEILLKMMLALLFYC